MIAKSENAALHKFIVQNSKTMFRAISEIVKNSVLIPSQNLVNELMIFFK